MDKKERDSILARYGDMNPSNMDEENKRDLREVIVESRSEIKEAFQVKMLNLFYPKSR